MTTASGTIWAVLQAGEYTTRYLRLGRGRSVILVTPSAQRGTVIPALAQHLATNKRLLVPDFAWEAAELCAWLRGFTDGLGITAADLVACDELCIAALECALANPDLVTRLVLIPGAATEEAVIEGYLSARGDTARTPMLIIRRPHVDDTTARAIATFIDDEPGA